MNDMHMLTGAYALDALDDLERARFEAHLDECAHCRVEVAEFRATAALLAEDAATTPPSELRGSVLGAISQVRPLAPLPEGAPQVHRRTRRWFTPLLVAASVLLAVGVGITTWSPWSDERPAPSATEQVLRASDATSVRLDFEDGSSARVVRSEEHGRAVIVTEDMASAPDGKVYELWLQVDGEMVPAGLMPDEPDQTVLLDGDASAATAVGITVEPAGGSESPTSEPIAVFDLAEAS